MSADLWQRGCERLAAELPEQQFNTWIRPLPPAEVSDRGDAGVVASLRVPNRFKLDWIRNQYAGRIETVLSELAGKPVRLDLTLAPRDGAVPRRMPAAMRAPQPRRRMRRRMRRRPCAAAAPAAVAAPSRSAPEPQR